MIKSSLNPEKFSISGYMNSTHVGLFKIKFHKLLMKSIEEKLEFLYKNYKGNFYANKVGFPWTAFPALITSLKNYNAKVGKETFIILYYDHNPIGIIDMDIPVIIHTCLGCGKEYKIIPTERTDIPKLNKVQRFFKKLYFHEAWEQTIVPISTAQKCTCGHQEFKSIMI